jgi:beta-galactosidase GanA
MEHPITKGVISAIPQDKADYRPDAVVKSALDLAWHIVAAELMFLNGVADGQFTFGGTKPVIRWRLQGEAAADPVRGPLNTGGLYGEREGWHLPGYGDGGWPVVDLPRAEWRRQGVTWYRTGFRLAVEPGVDASIGLELTDDPTRAYRVQIFLNGWNMGQYVNDVGPQHTFVLPNGILRTRGANTLALAALSDGTTESGPGEVRLTLLGSAAGGVPVTVVPSPGR